MKKRIFGLFLIIGMLVLADITVNAEIYSGICGAEGDGSNLTWKFDSDGTLTVSGTGTMKDYYGRLEPNIYSYFEAPWDKYSNDIKTIIAEEGVTSIGYSAFNGCANLTTVILPESLTGIHTEAFVGCTNLTNINFPKHIRGIGDRAFNGCTSLEAIDMPLVMPDLSGIGKSAFGNCTNLKSISLLGSADLTYLDIETFHHCTSLETIYFPSSITYVNRDCFAYCDNIKNVYYTGNEKEWDNIFVDTMNGALRRSDIHFKYFPVGFWASDTDSGYYFDGESKLGMIRFLFARKPEEGEVITKVGIKYVKGDSADNVLTDCYAESGNALNGAFYGDIYGIPENDNTTCYAFAYIIIDTNEVITSDVVSCTPNWSNDYSDYSPEGGAN